MPVVLKHYLGETNNKMAATDDSCSRAATRSIVTTGARSSTCSGILPVDEGVSNGSYYGGAGSESVRTATEIADRRKIFMDKLFTVSRMHVNEAAAGAADLSGRRKSFLDQQFGDNDGESQEEAKQPPPVPPPLPNVNETTTAPRLQSAVQYLMNLAEMTKVECGARQAQISEMVVGATKPAAAAGIGVMHCGGIQETVEAVWDQAPVTVETALSTMFTDEEDYDDDTYGDALNGSTFDQDTCEDNTTVSTGAYDDDETTEEQTCSTTGPPTTLPVVSTKRDNPHNVVSEDGTTYSSENSAWL
jgi:hypothetical protein